MNPKKLITVLLLVFVAGSMGYMVIRENKPCPKATQEVSQQPEPNQQIIVYYFHGDVRCPTCHKLEQYARESLETNFADWLASGKIKWQPTNIDTAGNEHFVKDYELVTKSVILSKTVNHQQVAWKNLDRIWELVSEEEKYLAYIRDSVRDFASEEHR
jgi:hypothetical protein